MNHPEPTADQIVNLPIDQILNAATRDDNTGICVACYDETCGGVEPDACGYECEACGEMTVYGAQELVMYL